MITFVPPFRRSTMLLVSLLPLLVYANPSKVFSNTYTVNQTTLDSFDGTHPRLLLDAGKVNAIRTNVANPPAGSRWGSIWSGIKTSADAWAATVPPTYVTPAANDEALYQQTVGNGIADFAMASLVTRTAQPSVDTRWVEAEDAMLVSPMAVQANASADGYEAIGTPVGGAVNSSTATPSAVYNFSTLKTAYYHVWARVYAPNNSANSFWFGWDNSAPISVSAVTYGSWIWINCGSRHLTPGTHQMEVTYQKPGELIDSFVITTDYSFQPAGLGTEQHWLDAADFTINTAANIAVNLKDGLATDDACLTTLTARTAAPATGAAADAQQTMSVNGGSYDVWVRFKAPAAANNGFYFALDGGAYNPVTLATGVAYNEWSWQRVVTGANLASGTHTLQVSGYKTGCEVDRFFVAPTGTAGPVDPNKYLTAARNWALASCNYPSWGNGAYGNNDLAAAGQLVGLSLFYDWCYADLGLVDRQILTTTLNNHGTLMYQSITGGSAQVQAAWWKNAWLQNHSWTGYNGLTFAGLAIHGDAGMPDTLPWLQAALSGIGNTFDDLPIDGADHEGPSYWASVEDLLRYMDVAKKELGVDFTGNTFFSQNGLWRLYFNTATSVVDASGPLVNFADSVPYAWSGPDHQLRRLASLYKQPAVQWLAGKYDDNRQNGFNISPTNAGNPWLNLVWYDPSVPETNPTNAGLPNFMHFPDLDFTISRSNWSGNEAVVGFQCGPPTGHHVLAVDKPYVEWGANHVHPAVNNFCFYDYGDWQIMNAGYTDKFSRFENTLLVNGAGQLGEGGFTFNGPATKTEDAGGVLNPAIDTNISFSTTPFDYVVGEGSGAYPTADHVTSYKRRLLYLRPDVLVVVDDVTLDPAYKKTLQINFYPYQRGNNVPVGYDTSVTQANPNEYLFNASGTYLRTNPDKTTTLLRESKTSFTDVRALVTPTTMSFSSAPTTDDGASYSRSFLSLSSGSAVDHMSTAVSISAAPLNVTPRAVTFLADPDGTAWKFKVGTATLVLDRNVNANYADEKARLVTTVEAESVTPASPIAVYTDEADASGGKYIAAATGTPANNPDTLTAPNAQYTLTAPAAGTYTIWARVKAADANSASFFYALNPSGGGAYTSTATTTTYGSWQWIKLTTTMFSTATSTNVLAVKYRQAGCKIDQFILTGDSTYAPEGKY
ncbi:MAG: DUF4962 domain-containing protein [Rhodospirillales bacterium]|nr:DUF4962 domain-containing protein [Acetobacter sp.]